MTRSIQGGKSTGWEYWGKRKGSFWVDRKTSHKMERMRQKEELRVLINDGISEITGGLKSLSDDPFMKSLFPNASSIGCYHHFIFGYDVLVVDGQHYGELESAYELLAYAYHTGVKYENYSDLQSKYFEHLDCGDERWGFLP